MRRLMRECLGDWIAATRRHPLWQGRHRASIKTGQQAIPIEAMKQWHTTRAGATAERNHNMRQQAGDQHRPAPLNCLGGDMQDKTLVIIVFSLLILIGVQLYRIHREDQQRSKHYED